MNPKKLGPQGRNIPWLHLLDERSRELLQLRARILRRGDEEAYHDIRVATRRLQELVAFLNPFLPQRRARRLWRRARKIRRAVSDTRNADVMRLVAAKLCPDLDQDHSRSLKKLCSRCLPVPRRRRPRSLPEARKRIAALRARFHDPAPGAVRTRAEQLLEERLARLAKARRNARSGSPRAMHRLRIAVKHYRYLLELLSPLGLVGAEPVLEKAQSAQHTLGKLHDLDMLVEFLEDNGSSKDMRRALARERQRRLQESRREIATLPVIDIRWKPGSSPARRPRRAKR
ncbi:MAG TPA: CHAD domain-containing protein [Candidatus Polarisedimenticolia bacterium]|nr:CHAD domain-containing protein [Candidatus Polarisedimenticolia bacterium]